MKFTVNTMDFKEALAKVSKVIVPSKYTPVLENVKVTVADNKCYLSATNLEQFVTAEIYANTGIELGEFIFSDTKTLLKAMKFYNDVVIVFEVAEGKVKISCGGKKAEQATLQDEFPETPELDVENVNEYKYNVKKLKERFNLVKYACSKVEAKPVLTGIHFNNEDIVACDGFRLAVNEDNGLYVNTPFTMPQNALKFASEVLEGDIEMKVNHKLIVMTDGDTTFTSRLLDGDYIDYKSVFPKDGTKLEVDVKSFNEGIKYLKTFYGKATVKTNPVVWNNDRLKFINSTGVYESDVEVNGEFDFEIGFNMDYLTDALTQFKTKAVDISVCNNLSPIVLTSEGDENTALLLPVRVKESYFNEEVA